MQYLKLGRFKTALRRGLELPPRFGLDKDTTGLFEPLEDRQVRFTISTAAIDRDRDTVSVAGWDLEHFKRNPRVLWSHNASLPPIAKCIDIGVDGDALKAVCEFVPADMPEIGNFAEMTLRMLRTGFLSATSVGFMPLEYVVAKDRDSEDSWFPPIDFLRQELMEFSVVNIPANRDALLDDAELPLPGVSLLAVQAAETAQAFELETRRLEAVMFARKRRALEARLIGIGR